MDLRRSAVDNLPVATVARRWEEKTCSLATAATGLRSSAERLTTRLVSEGSDLRESLSGWREMAPTPMQTPEWMLAWWSAFQSPATRLAVVLIESPDGQLIGLAPLFIRDSWALGRTIRFLGSGRACTDFQTLLARDGRHQEVADAVADWLLDPEQNQAWGFVELEGISDNCPAISQLLTRLESGGCTLHTAQLESTWRLDLSLGWDGYLARLSKSQRAKTRNRINQTDKNSSFEFKIFNTKQSIPEALEICMKLHQKRWSVAGKPGCFSDPRFVNFTQDSCNGLGNYSNVEIALLSYKSRPAASALFLRDDQGVAYLYQGGRDPKYDSLSVGRALQYLYFRSSSMSGVTAVDFLRGDEPYKSRIGAAPTPCWRVRAVAPSAISRVRDTVWCLGRDLKHRVTCLGNKVLPR